MHHPQDLPGRYGRVVKAVDRVLQSIHCAAVLAGAGPCGITVSSPE